MSCQLAVQVNGVKMWLFFAYSSEGQALFYLPVFLLSNWSAPDGDIGIFAMSYTG